MEQIKGRPARALRKGDVEDHGPFQNWGLAGANRNQQLNSQMGGDRILGSGGAVIEGETEENGDGLANGPQ